MKLSGFLEIISSLSTNIYMPYKPIDYTRAADISAFGAEIVPSFSASSSFYREIILIDNWKGTSLETPAESLSPAPE